MKRLKALVILAAVLVMAMFAQSCAEPKPGDPDNPINLHPPDAETQTVNLSFVYDEELAHQTEPATAESSFVSMVKDEIINGFKSIIMPREITPNAITPDFPPTYVAIGGDAINPLCTNPWDPACRTDISAYCNSGVCNVSIAIPVGTWRGLWFFYAGQVQVARMALTSTQMTPNTYYLSNFMTIAGDTLPATSPLHKTWPAACVRVDRPTPTTIEVNRNVAAQSKCQDALIAVDLYVIGDSADNRLDDDLLAWTGDPAHDGDMKIKSTLLPPTVTDPLLFPRLLWNTAATPQPAYTHTFASVTTGMSYWHAIYSHDRGSAADPAQISPIKGGVYVRTRRYDTTTRTFVTTPSCGGSGFGIELVNMQNLNQLNPAIDPFYVLQVQSTNATTYCPVQGPDTRPVIFGFSN